MSAIDSFLNKITMYRLMLYALWALFGVSVVESFLGWLSYTPLELLVSLLLLFISVWAVNSACALFTKSVTTPESAFITAFILFFILSPIQSSSDALFFLLAGAIAMLSKYLLVFGQRHIFNPAAIAAVVLSIAGTGLVVWWVATPVLLPFVLVSGFLILRKVRQFKLFWYFLITATAVFIAKAAFLSSPLIPALSQFFVSFPLFYFGAFMLTDPQTMPAASTHRRIFAVVVGLFFSASFALGPFTSTPELALLIGNLYAFATVLLLGKRNDLSQKNTLSLHSVTKLSRDVYEYTFESSAPLKFQPGQYLEWTIGHKSSDKRGIRRYFSISSAPSDPFVRFGIKIPVESSTFKKSLSGLKKGSEVSVTGVFGSFILPKDPEQKVLALASGIGIAPFMSMFREIAARRERRHIVLIYAATTPLDFVYQDELAGFEETIGLKVVYLSTDFSELSDWDGPSGYITDQLLRKEVPDYDERYWYLSGPSALVESYTAFAKKLGISSRFIKTEYFPGF